MCTQAHLNRPLGSHAAFSRTARNVLHKPQLSLARNTTSKLLRQLAVCCFDWRECLPMCSGAHDTLRGFDARALTAMARVRRQLDARVLPGYSSS